MGLPSGAQKSKITKASREVVNRFEAELAAEIERRERPPSDIPVFENMVSWLNAVKPNIQLNTYSEEEWLTLLKLSRGDDIYPAIMLAGCLGLRRSEALGVRWSRIDWEQRTVLLDTKIVEYTEDHKKVALPVEEMKNQSSRRTLPLPPMVVEMLEEQKARQELYRKMFKGSYNRKFDDYVCVNQLGELMMPSYVTSHFGDLLKKLGLRKIRFHDLRHTFASILINNDVPQINVSNFLGHSDISTTVSTNYRNTNEKWIVRAV